MESDLSSTLASIQANCKHDIVDQMMQVERHYQLCDLKSVEWARNLSCLRRLSRKRRRGAYDDEEEDDWSSNTLGRGSTNGHSDYIAVSYPWKAAAPTGLCDPATQRTTAATNVDSAAAGAWKIAVPGNPRRVDRSKVRDAVLRRAVAYAETHGTELIWIDRECVPQDEDGERENTHLHETAMQSMDLVYRWAKHPIALIFESVACQEEVDLLEALLRGSVVEVRGFDGDFTGPPPTTDDRRPKSKSKENEASSVDDDSDSDDADPETDHPRFASSVSASTISSLLALLTRLTSDPWFSRAWIFQENYCAGAKMRLLIPHSRAISKAHAVDLFGNIPHELNVRSIAFFNAATKFCLAYLADPRYVGSAQAKAQCEAIIHRAGRYNLLHRYGFVSETGSTSPTEIALQAEVKERRQRRHRHRGGGNGERKKQHATSRPFSRAMSTTILADLAARRITQPHDILAIAANCCAYDARLDTKALRSAGTVAEAAKKLAGAIVDKKKGKGKEVAIDEVYQSLSAAVLALWFLNGEVFKNMLPPPPEPQVPSEYPDITISPVGDGRGEGEESSPANDSTNADKNNDFDTSDAPLSLTLSTSLTNQQPLSKSPLPPSGTSIPPTPITSLTALSFLSRTALDSFIPPSPSSPSFRAGPLTFLKSCRFRCVQLTHSGVATRGHVWLLDERIETRGWNAPVARAAQGGRFWRRRRGGIDPLALLAAELRGRAKGKGVGGEKGARYTWLARRLDAMVAVRAAARRAAEEKRERRRAKKMGLRAASASASLKSKSGGGNPKTTKGKQQQRVDEATLARLKESVTTFDRCMADAVAEAIRDGRDLILARAWDGVEDPAAQGEDGPSSESAASKKKRKKVYRAIFVWDEMAQQQGEDGGEGGESETEDEVDEVDDEVSGGADMAPCPDPGPAKARNHFTDKRTIPLSTSTSTTDTDSDTPLARLPSRTKAKILQSVAHQSSRPSSSSSSISSLTSLSSLSSSSPASESDKSTFAPTLAFTSHTPSSTRYRFDRRTALEQSHIDKFVSLEVALDGACPTPSPETSTTAATVDEPGDGDGDGDGEDENEGKGDGRTRRRRRSRSAQSSSRKNKDENTAATAQTPIHSTPPPPPQPPLLRTKRWINGLAFLPSPPPPPSTNSAPRTGGAAARSACKRGAGAQGKTASAASKSNDKTASSSKHTTAAAAKVKVSVRGKEKAKAHIEATTRVLRARRACGRHGGVGKGTGEGKGEDEDGDESWEDRDEEDEEGEQAGEKWEEDGHGDGDEEGKDWQTGERGVVFAWPEGLARK
ncbi:hypothetical protein IWZ00DRAFT_564799 [Phyllosticta capitalensis]